VRVGESGVCILGAGSYQTSHFFNWTRPQIKVPSTHLPPPSMLLAKFRLCVN
jgi:hypothetical protein